MRLLFAGFVSAMLLAGCGSNGPGEERLTKAEYQQRLHNLVSNDQIAAVHLFDDLVTGPHPQAECGQKAEAFHAELEKIVAKVAALSPPEDVAHLQDEFLDAARESVDKIGQVAQEVAGGKLACGEQLNRAIYGLPSTERAERALNSIESKGYVIFGD
jgi:hypothetical protein